MHSSGEGSLSYSRLLGFTLSASGVDVCAQQGRPSIQVFLMEYFTLTSVDIHASVCIRTYIYRCTFHIQIYIYIYIYIFVYGDRERELESGRERERERESDR